MDRDFVSSIAVQLLYGCLHLQITHGNMCQFSSYFCPCKTFRNLFCVFVCNNELRWRNIHLNSGVCRIKVQAEVDRIGSEVLNDKLKSNTQARSEVE
jgi:hypothetical protein